MRLTWGSAKGYEVTTLNGKELFVLDEWSEQIKVYPGVCNMSSSLGIAESRYVSDKQIISNWWSIICAFKRNDLE